MLKSKPDRPAAAHEDTGHLFSALAHGRSLFEYHAGQRQTSLRDFFYAYGLFSGGYVLLFRTGPMAGVMDELLLAAVAVLSLVIIATFEKRDQRNAELVDVDEAGLEEIEDRLAAKLRLSRFEITRHSDGNHDASRTHHYSVWVPQMFGVFKLVSVVLLFAAPFKDVAAG